MGVEPRAILESEVEGVASFVFGHGVVYSIIKHHQADITSLHPTL
jgi:hypothetical protein